MEKNILGISREIDDHAHFKKEMIEPQALHGERLRLCSRVCRQPLGQILHRSGMLAVLVIKMTW